MAFVYNLFVTLYSAGISIASVWNKKAAQWKRGRNTLWTALDQTFSKPHTVIWIHSASAGEFEQAKPLIEALKKTYPSYKILVTFFSPSGYPAGKAFALADYVFYLPLDTKANAERFVKTVQPVLVFFIKYDFWYHHLKAVHNRNIPLILVSALFRKEQPFFKPHGRFYASMLHFFTHLFVQDETSYGLLKKLGIDAVSIAGDTRFDRVRTIAHAFEEVPHIAAFAGDKKVIVAGSTWPDDEALLHAAFTKISGAKLILAPHEITPSHLKNITQLFQTAISYSSLKEVSTHELFKKVSNADVLIIDNVGMLSRLYRYATVAYVGGGFTRGIHNTLEAAVFGKPVLFGPNYKKFREARELITAGGAFACATEKALENNLKKLLSDNATLQKSSAAAAAYVQENSGATQKIMAFIQENRLLTN